MINIPNCSKMAADSSAQEVAERELDVPAKETLSESEAQNGLSS